ncbi:glycosyltransferase [Novosphingobium sp. B1]|uniref:glycosyltransferase n=1 Tax=Novosphingobium sp. B1 TaxID=1938756 RepID=UPI0009FF82D6|nr:glycosyltransferase [Novosphingobium sp. B1]
MHNRHCLDLAVKSSLVAIAIEKKMLSQIGNSSKAPLPRLVLMTGALVRGGMEMQFLDLAREHHQNGGEVVTIGANGPLLKSFMTFGKTVLTDFPIIDRKSFVDAVVGEIRNDTVCIIALQSDYFSLIPLLAKICRVLVCAHNRSGTFEQWLPAKSLTQLTKIFQALENDGRLALSASSRTNADAHAKLFGLKDSTVKAWYPSVCTTDLEPLKEHENDLKIGIIARLSPEKLLLLQAAVHVLRAALASGDKAKLLVAGEGIARAEFEEWANASGLGDNIEFLGESTDPVSTCRRFDIAVVNGRVALEALLAGCRVITVSVDETADHELRLHSVVTCENIEILAEDNFAPTLNKYGAENLLKDAKSISDFDRAQLQKWVVEKRSAGISHKLCLDRVIDISIERSASATEYLLEYYFAIYDSLFTIDQSEQLRNERALRTEVSLEMEKAQNWISEQRDAIQWLAEQRDNWEKVAIDCNDQLESLRSIISDSEKSEC